MSLRRATAEYPATIVPDCTCAHIFKERDMCRNKLTQVAGYSAVKLLRLLSIQLPSKTTTAWERIT